MKTRRLRAAVAVLCCACGVGSASAQCANYTIQNPGPATYIPATNDSGNHVDDGTTAISLPFAVNFYGASYTAARVSSNGSLQFSTTGSTTFTNACLPTTTFGFPAIAPHWDDMRTDTSGSGVFTEVVGSAPNRQFVVEWRTTYFSPAGVALNFEIIFTEGQNDFDIVLGTIPNSGVSATIGAQAGSTGPATQFSCNTATAPSGTSLRFVCVPPAPGACCFSDGTCAVVLSTACTSPNVFAGDNSTCSATNTCPLTDVGACCSTTGVCTYIASSAACASPSTFVAAGTCSPNSCTALLSACCSSSGGCSLTTAAGCTGATQTYLTGSATCAPSNPCTPLLGSCCNVSTAACTNTTANGCSTATSTFLGAGTVCGVNLCAGTGACCSPAGACSITLQTGCAAGSFFQGVGVACGPTNPCAALTGACCATDGTCSVRPAANCPAPQLFAGISTACDATGACPVTARACCNNTSGVCTFQTAACATGSTETGAVCSPTPCPSTPPVAAGIDFGDPVGQRGTVVLQVTITTPGNNPPSASYMVTTDASSIGGSTNLALADDGSGVDLVAGDGVFAAAVNVSVAAGAYPLTFTVIDDQARSPAAAVTTTVNISAAITGACCQSDGTCAVLAGEACIAGGGTFQGPGTVCSGPFYTLGPSANAFASIAATGTQLATVSNADDGTESAAIGFTFNFLGTDYTSVNVSSNGNLQFGGSPSTSFSNVAIPNAATPNNMLAPLWDDFNLSSTYPAGDAYLKLDGAAPSRTLTISWENVSQFGLTSPGDSSNFQVVLYEGSNDFEFRYGSLSTGIAGTNDFGTVGFENAAGTAGLGIERNRLHGGNTAIRGTRADITNPCAPPTGACCCGSTCSLTQAGDCTGTNQSFRGAGTACNAPGNNTAPCCKADYNQSGTVSVQDIFDFLAGYFTGSGCADINASGSISVQDIFDFLSAYFSGCN